MDYDQLLSMLDIEEPYEFQCFENTADLLESTEEIDEGALYNLIKRIDKTVLTELLSGYIDEVCENIPDFAMDLFTVFSTVKLSLCSIARESQRDAAKEVLLADEILRFRKWYSQDKVVLCTDKTQGTTSNCTVAEAIATYRLEKLGDGEYDFDFDRALDYQIDEYAVHFTDIPFDDDDSDEEYREEDL